LKPKLLFPNNLSTKVIGTSPILYPFFYAFIIA